MLAKKKPEIKVAYGKLCYASNDRDTIKKYYDYEDAVRDYDSAMKIREKKGHEEGREEERYAMIENLIKIGIKKDDISKAARVSLNEIERIAEGIRE